VLVTFFDSQGIIHTQLVPQDFKVNKDYYVEALSCLVQSIHGVRPQFQERGSWFLSRDNARHNTAASLQQFLTKQGIPELIHPQKYSPALSPSCFLLSEIKATLRGRRF
jgi:hypothetical protein